jgi:hypothetical protein
MMFGPHLSRLATSEILFNINSASPLFISITLGFVILAISLGAMFCIRPFLTEDSVEIYYEP